MRLDKYLKTARIIKRRTIASEACGAGRVSVNGKTTKAGAEVREGDIIEIGFGASKNRVRVLSVAENVGKAGASAMYENIQ
ncbi:MAG: RNA-binding S4 domain-containing protein [Clostridiales bacterium]|jgi:ribosomal 50S subunit-recycling heat shock protein|nr:RNA-binding S4 domain-containing protein [Clostridiales bacterium]